MYEQCLVVGAIVYNIISTFCVRSFFLFLQMFGRAPVLCFCLYGILKLYYNVFSVHGFELFGSVFHTYFRCFFSSLHYWMLNCVPNSKQIVFSFLFLFFFNSSSEKQFNEDLQAFHLISFFYSILVFAMNIIIIHQNNIMKIWQQS